MTADEFEQAYAKRSGCTAESLRQHRTARPCECGDETCDGWQMISYERAEEYDRLVADGMAPVLAGRLA